MPAVQLLHAEAPAAAYVPAQGKPGQQRQGGKAEPERQATERKKENKATETETQRERDRERDRQTQRHTQREKDRQR